MKIQSFGCKKIKNTSKNNGKNNAKIIAKQCAIWYHKNVFGKGYVHWKMNKKPYLGDSKKKVWNEHNGS